MKECCLNAKMEPFGDTLEPVFQKYRPHCLGNVIAFIQNFKIKNEKKSMKSKKACY